MSTYREFRAEAKKKKRLRTVQHVGLVVLMVLLLCGLGLFVASALGYKLPLPFLGGQNGGQQNSLPATSGGVPQADAAAVLPAATSAVTKEQAWRGVQTEKTINTFNPIATDRRMLSLPENGRVELSYFDDVTFVGDSITTGWSVYSASTGLPNARVVAEISTSPPVGGVQWVHNRDASQIYDPMQAIADTVPKKVYVMFGTNMLVNQSEATEDKLVNDYAAFIDDLGARIPGCEIYIQSILIPTEKGTAAKPGLNAERINRVNNRLAALAFEKGCHYLNVQEYLCRDGVLNWDIAASDGIHLNPEGYRAWLEYLATHTAYNPAAAYVGGSPYPATPAAAS